MTFFLVHSECPSEQALSEVLSQTSNPVPLLTALWRTQKIPHRQFVIAQAERLASQNAEVFQRLEPLVIEATADADVEVRELAFATLRRLKHPKLRELALQQLSDVDPAVRLLGLQTLRGIASSNEVPMAVRLLSDPEPRVVVAAALLLRKATGQNFGIKTSDALPQFTCIDTNPPPFPDVRAIRDGVQQCREWWDLNQVKYGSLSDLILPRSSGHSLPTDDFALQNSEGKSVRLSEFRGTNVLVVFWSPGAPASLDDAEALNALQQEESRQLVVLGVCIPAAPSCADAHQTATASHSDMSHHNHECCAPPQDAARLRALAKQATERLKISFPMLVDPRFALGARFNASDLPMYVLIDDRSMIRRRFIGFRSKSVFSAMAAETARYRTMTNLAR